MSSAEAPLVHLLIVTQNKIVLITVVCRHVVTILVKPVEVCFIFYLLHIQ